MAAYPTPGGFLPDQGDLNFDLPDQDLFLVVRVEWMGRAQSKFVVATDAATAVKLSGALDADQGKRISVSAIQWSELEQRAKAAKEEWTPDFDLN